MKRYIIHNNEIIINIIVSEKPIIIQGYFCIEAIGDWSNCIIGQSIVDGQPGPLLEDNNDG